MRSWKHVVVLGLLAVAGPALAQDGGSAWGEEKPKTAPRTAPADGETPTDGDASTVTAPREQVEEPVEVEVLELAKAGAAIDKIEVSVDPAESPPGGVVLVTVIFRTAAGKAVPGVTFDLLAKEGAVGEVAEQDGRYTTAFEVSVYAEDEAKLSVITESGLHEMVKIAVSGEAVAPMSEPSVEEAAVAEAPKEEKPPKEKKPKGDFEPTWLHVAAGGAGALYAYAQEPDADDSGPLIEDTLAFGGDDGPAARAAGGAVSGSVWLPSLEYLGFQAHLRFIAYSVESSAFEGAASDWLYDGGVFVAGRVPLDVAGGQIWGGGRLGFIYDDFLSFQGCLEGGCQVKFITIGTPGLGLGPRAGAEFGPLIAEIGYTAGLARFTQPYRNALDVDVGVVVFDPLTVELGLDVISRTIGLESKETSDVRGTIKDNQMVVGLGVGLVF